MQKQFHEYWRGVTWTFACPTCQQLNVEKGVVNATTDDQAKIQEQINAEPLKCQRCKNPLPEGANVVVDVTPRDTPESLRKQGFPVPAGT